MPAASPPVYSGAITVCATETLNAMTFATGLSNSAVTTAAYTINLATPRLNFASGFRSTSAGHFNGPMGARPRRAKPGLPHQSTSRRSPADFTFQATSAIADGFTFAIQKSAGGIDALGSGGAELGD